MSEKILNFPQPGGNKFLHKTRRVVKEQGKYTPLKDWNGELWKFVWDTEIKKWAEEKFPKQTQFKTVEELEWEYFAKFVHDAYIGITVGGEK